MTTYPYAVIRFPASDLILNVHSDVSYLSAGKTFSCAGGYVFLNSLPKAKQSISLNDNIHAICTILKLVATSAAKAKLGAFSSTHGKSKFYD